MTDERLAELRQDLEATSAKQVALKRQREDMHSRVVQLADEAQRTNLARKDLDVPYKNACERVGDLTAQILAEENRRAAEAAAARQAELAAAKDAAEKAAAEAAAAAQVPQPE